MGSYLIRRFFLMLLTLFGISVLIFTMLRVVPGNIADIVFNAAGMIDVAEKAKLEKELGWRALENFDSGIEKTVRWYLANEWWWRPLRETVYAGERLGVLDERPAAETIGSR